MSWLSPAWLALASFVTPSTPDQQIQDAEAIFRGVVLTVEPFRSPTDGRLYTQTTLQVEEVFKGRLPSILQLTHRGGKIGATGETDGLAPRFQRGEDRLLFVSRSADGTLHCPRGYASALLLSGPGEPHAAGMLKVLRGRTKGGLLPGADCAAQAGAVPDVPAVPGLWGSPPPAFGPQSNATNLLTWQDSIPARFLAPDRGEPIPYVVDGDFLPSGITLTQALAAVDSALAAWTNVTSLRFMFAGIRSFGKPAPDMQEGEGVLWIQLHDAYGYITGTGDVLGRGGSRFSILNLNAGWTLGGNVAGNDFHKSIHGFVVLKHTSQALSNLANFQEVLCHEVGHAIGIDHSTENPAETNPILTNAVMYYSIHGSGRGAVLGTFDINVSGQVHPPHNTPPFTFDRALDLVSTPTPATFYVPGVNSVALRGYDLQNSTLSRETADAALNYSTMELNGDVMTFIPTGFYSDSPRRDPSLMSGYDIVFIRYSDGVNASPYAAIKTVSYAADYFSEGIPDSWRLRYFGNETPGAVPNTHAWEDYDRDSFTNLQEFLLGSNPSDPQSNLNINSSTGTALTWAAKPYDLYEVFGTTNLVDWTLVRPLLPTASPATGSDLPMSAPTGFFRVLRVP